MKKNLNKQKNYNKTKQNTTETKKINQNKAKNKTDKQTEAIVYSAETLNPAWKPYWILNR